MKTTRIIISSICLSLVVLTGFYAWGQRNVTKLRHGSEQHKDNFPKLALAYVEDYRKGIPDDGNFTHLICQQDRFHLKPALKYWESRAP